jgi:hypothetical protein
MGLDLFDRKMKDLSEATVEAATQSTEHKRDDKENERNKKYDFRDADGSAGNSTEAQKAGNQGDYEKRNNKIQHDHSPSMRAPGEKQERSRMVPCFQARKRTVSKSFSAMIKPPTSLKADEAEAACTR